MKRSELKKMIKEEMEDIKKSSEEELHLFTFSPQFKSNKARWHHLKKVTNEKTAQKIIDNMVKTGFATRGLTDFALMKVEDGKYIFVKYLN